MTQYHFGYLIFLPLLTIAWLLKSAYTRYASNEIPVVRRSWRQLLQYSNPISEIVDRGYNSVNKALNKPFRLAYWGQEYLVLPPRYLADVKKADRHHLDFFASVQDVFFLKYWIGDLFESDRMVYTTKKGLNPHLPEATNLCIEEAAGAFEVEFGDCTSFKSFNTLEALLNITHRTASKILVGDELCRDPTFCKASYSYFQGHGITGGILLYLPLGPFRDLFARPISYFQRVRQRKVLNIVSAEIEKRMEDIRDNKDRTPRFDCIEWTIKMLDEFPIEEGGSPPLWRMSHELIHLLGASHTPTGMTVTQMIWKILAYPEYLEPLRKEADEAIELFGFTEKIVGVLPLQDSFIRETNRLHPNHKLSTQRVVSGAPFVCRDGLTLPVGTRLAFPVDSYLKDPATFSDPEQFDGYRFVKLVEHDTRTEEGVNKWAASHAHATNQTFGYGAHVCPGRFFAVRLMKIIFTKLITDYDFRWDYAGPGTPPSMHMEGSIFPNMTQKIQLRKRVR